MANLVFSGHETFHCRHYWLKKGVDFLAHGKSFKDELALLDLGVVLLHGHLT